MSKSKYFDWSYWLRQSSGEEKQDTSRIFKTSRMDNKDSCESVELLIKAIESEGIDLTQSYEDWLTIGFALADEFHESGRNYFHRVSQFHTEYSLSNCDDQFDKCLKSNKSGVTINSLFYLAKLGGIRIVPNQNENRVRTVSDHPNDNGTHKNNLRNEEFIRFNTPRIPLEVYENLPELLKRSTEMFEQDIEKDVLLIGALGVISACLPKVSGKYFEEDNSPHLYVFVTAPAGSGKGKLNWTKYFGQAIHKAKRIEYENSKLFYEKDIALYDSLDKKAKLLEGKPIEPPNKMFFIPANSSGSALLKALKDNQFQGVIFETEADTLTGTFKQDWGNFSDVLRKAFHHETANLSRRKDNEYIELDNPHLAIVLSGTPKQVKSLIPDVENGLFSRFLFYAFEENSPFLNPFISYQSESYVEFFEAIGERMLFIYQTLNNLPYKIEFQFTEEQGKAFTDKFDELYQKNKALFGSDFTANSRRLGLITFRIAMILTTLRCFEDGDLPERLICSDIDFEISLRIATTLDQHSIAVYQYLSSAKVRSKQDTFLDCLPRQFNRQDYLRKANAIQLKPKTAEKYITDFTKSGRLHHEHNSYTKIDSLN